MTATVLVLGPPLSGVSTAAALLRDRLDGCVVIEPAGLPAGRRPDVVVFLASAAAPMTACERALLMAVADRTDAIVAAVTKVDVHRTWREVLDANRASAQQRLGRRRPVPWVGVAAGTEIGPPIVADLVIEVRRQLARRREQRRNADEHPRAVRSSAGRVHIQQTRIRLAGHARRRCAQLQAELQEGVGAVSLGAAPEFESRAARLAAYVVEEFETVVGQHLQELCAATGIPEVALPRMPALQLPRPRDSAAEDRLAAVLGTGFGLGVTLTAGRLMADAIPAGLPAGGVALPVCGAAGVVLTWWVVRTRRLVTLRASMARRAGDVAAGVRSTLDERVLAIESALLSAHLDVLVRGGP